MAKTFFTEQEQQQIINAIAMAESRTNGEIRLHIEAYCKDDAYKRAQEVFEQLNMHATKQRNGVLLYVAYEDHKLAILGDKGIYEKTGADFWVAEKDLLVSYFKKDAYSDGLSKAIHDVGEKLAAFFPKTADNTNELTNDISFGGGKNE
jgi:uncharacterized membrane protein